MCQVVVSSRDYLEIFPCETYSSHPWYQKTLIAMKKFDYCQNLKKGCGSVCVYMLGLSLGEGIM